MGQKSPEKHGERAEMAIQGPRAEVRARQDTGATTADGWARA